MFARLSLPMLLPQRFMMMMMMMMMIYEVDPVLVIFQ